MQYASLYRSIITGTLLAVVTLTVLGQESTSGRSYHVLPGRIIDGDTIYLASIQEVVVLRPRKFRSKYQERQYWRLVQNIKKVYPYSKLAGRQLQEMNQHFLSLKTEKEREEYVKQMENKMRAQYEEELKGLTITQGRILIKLVDRETGNTSYHLVKELRGTMSAVFWQTLARLFGSNLKTKYDPEGEDKMMEEIIQLIEMGYL
jgi:hypothetical protein